MIVVCFGSILSGSIMFSHTIIVSDVIFSSFTVYLSSSVIGTRSPKRITDKVVVWRHSSIFFCIKLTQPPKFGFRIRRSTHISSSEDREVSYCSSKLHYDLFMVFVNLCSNGVIVSRDVFNDGMTTTWMMMSLHNIGIEYNCIDWIGRESGGRVNVHVQVKLWWGC